MTFGERVRQLRHSKKLSLRKLAPKVGVGYAYLSRVETGSLNFGDYPSDALIHRLADVLDGDEDELLLLAERIPERIRRRVLERPDAFQLFARLDDATINKILKSLRHTVPKR